jgi:hypothetical protein
MDGENWFIDLPISKGKDFKYQYQVHEDDGNNIKEL